MQGNMQTEQIQLSTSQATSMLVSVIRIFILFADTEIIKYPIEYIICIRSADDESQMI